MPQEKKLLQTFWDIKTNTWKIYYNPDDQNDSLAISLDIDLPLDDALKKLEKTVRDNRTYIKFATRTRENIQALSQNKEQTQQDEGGYKPQLISGLTALFVFSNAVITSFYNYFRAKYPDSVAVMLAGLVISLVANAALVIFSLSVYYPNFLYSNAEKKKKQYFDNYLLKLLQRLLPARNEIINKENLISRLVNVAQINGEMEFDYEENGDNKAIQAKDSLVINLSDLVAKQNQRVLVKRYFAYRLDSKRDYSVYDRIEKSIEYLESICLFKDYKAANLIISNILKIQVFVSIEFNDLFTTEQSGQSAQAQLGTLLLITDIGELIEHLHHKKNAYHGYKPPIESYVIDRLLIMIDDVNKLKLLKNILDIIEKAGLDTSIDYQNPSACYLMRFYKLVYENNERMLSEYKMANENLSKLTMKQKNTLIHYAGSLFATAAESGKNNCKIFLEIITNYKQLIGVVGLTTEPSKSTLKQRGKLIAKKARPVFHMPARNKSAFFRTHQPPAFNSRSAKSFQGKYDYQDDSKDLNIENQWQNKVYQLQHHDINFCAEYLFNDMHDCHFMPAQQSHKKIESADLVKALEVTATPFLNESQDVISIFNKDANHWVCYKLSARGKILYVVYKDSYGHVYDEIFKSAIKQVYAKTYEIKFIYFSSQEQPFKDAVNCGIYAVKNAVALAGLDCNGISTEEEMAFTRLDKISDKSKFMQLSSNNYDAEISSERELFANLYAMQNKKIERANTAAFQRVSEHEEKYVKPIRNKLARVPYFKDLLADMPAHSMLSIDCRSNPEGVLTLNFNLKGHLIPHTNTFISFFQMLKIKPIIEREPMGDCVHLKISLQDAILVNDALNDKNISYVASKLSSNTNTLSPSI